MPSIKKLSLVAVAVTGAVVAALSWPGAAHSVPARPALGTFEYWSTVGSAGTIDEADRNLYKTNGPKVAVLDTGGVAVLNVRYNVTSVDNLINPPGDTTFIQARYKDNGNNAQIVVKLRELDVDTGNITTILTFDSDDFADSNNVQTNFVSDNDAGWEFDFSQYAYWLDVTITRGNTNGKPSLEMIQVGTF